MSKCIKIADKIIGDGYPTYIISELSANHLNNLDIALKVVEASVAAGADAIKIQTLTPDTMTIDCDAQDFIVNDGTLWDGRKLYDLYSETPLPYEWHKPIFERCDELGITCFSTPYDISALEFLDQFDPPAYKISSFEINDILLIKEVAKRNKPMIISTGIAGICDISDALEACYSVGNKQVALLKCTSAYPAPYGAMNLATIRNIKETFNVVSGLSDHTLGIEVPIAAVALGASIIEKHVTLDRHLGGVDAPFSLEPKELTEMVNAIRNIQLAIGKIDYSILEKAAMSKLRFGRSLYFVEDIKKGDEITTENMRSIRPGFGLPPKYFDQIIGKTVLSNISRGTAVSWELIK